MYGLGLNALRHVRLSVRGSFRSLFLSVVRPSSSKPGNNLKFSVSGLERVQHNEEPRFFDWIKTEEGKMSMALWVGWGGTALIFVASWSLYIYCLEPTVHEYCLEENRSHLNIYSPFSSEFQSDERLSSLSTQCLPRSGVDVQDFDRLLLFESETLDPVINGFLKTSSGAVIGCPSYFLADNIIPRDLTYKTHYNRWFKGFRLPTGSSEEMVNKLKESLTLTKEEKSFIMSFSMAKVNSWQAVCNVIAPVFTWFMAYNAGHAMNKKLNMFSRPLAARVALVGWMGAMHLLLYVIWFNYGNFELETDCLRKVLKCPQHVDAGVSYYKKLLQRNKLLRELVGQEMNYYIQEDGEYEPMFYQVRDCNFHKRIESLEEIRRELSS